MEFLSGFGLQMDPMIRIPEIKDALVAAVQVLPTIPVTYIIINAGDANIPGPSALNAVVRKLLVGQHMSLMEATTFTLRYAVSANTGGWNKDNLRVSCLTAPSRGRQPLSSKYKMQTTKIVDDSDCHSSVTYICLKRQHT